MANPPIPRDIERRPVLFVAREPDETLKTFLPVIDHLRAAHTLESRVLFHHQPGRWAREALDRRAIRVRQVRLPECGPSNRTAWWPLGRSRHVKTFDEIWRFGRARALARRVLAEERPSAVVVIQDTLLLERFLVREANRRGLPTVVVQWAFSFPQALYDRLKAIGRSEGTDQEAARPSALRRRLLPVTGPVTGMVYRGVLRGLGLRFDLANSYGGGEARLFAVMGQAFEEQYRTQGVRSKRIVVTGHPTHDAAFSRAIGLTEAERTRLRAEYRLAADETIVLYATQPVLWRRVMTPAELEANVRAIAEAVDRSSGRPRLVIKLHPREQPEQYAFCAELDPPVPVIERAEMSDLIAASDAFISSSSSTVLLAMMLGRPIVTVNFNQVPHFDVFESLGGTLHARTPAELARAIRLALGDPVTRERLAAERRSVLSRYTRFDGCATERLAGLIAEGVAGR